MDYSLPGSSVHGIFQARRLDGLPFPSPGDLLDPGIQPTSPLSPVLGSRFFTTVPPGKPGGVGRNHSLLCDVSVFFFLHFGRLSNHFLSQISLKHAQGNHYCIQIPGGKIVVQQN